MYGVVLMTVLVGTTEAPDFGRRSRGCDNYSVGCCQPYVYCYPSSCDCYGWYPQPVYGGCGVVYGYPYGGVVPYSQVPYGGVPGDATIDPAGTTGPGTGGTQPGRPTEIEGGRPGRPAEIEDGKKGTGRPSRPTEIEDGGKGKKIDGEKKSPEKKKEIGQAGTGAFDALISRILVREVLPVVAAVAVPEVVLVANRE